MKWVGTLMCALTLLILMSGCSSGERGREPEDTVLAEVLGIDRVGVTWVLTTAGKAGTGETVLQTVEGETLTDVFAAIPSAGEKWVLLTGVAQILIGDGVEPREVLTFILKDSGISWRATVWYAPLAKGLMEEVEGGAARLNVLEESGEKTVTVLDSLEELTSEGETELPVLTVRNGQIEIAGVIGYELAEKV